VISGHIAVGGGGIPRDDVPSVACPLDGVGFFRARTAQVFLPLDIPRCVQLDNPDVTLMRSVHVAVGGGGPPHDDVPFVARLLDGVGIVKVRTAQAFLPLDGISRCVQLDNPGVGASPMISDGYVAVGGVTLSRDDVPSVARLLDEVGFVRVRTAQASLPLDGISRSGQTHEDVKS
jgi:hypothetical protein